ncbi:MAG: hypothetical protein A2931_01280 [Candidatus Niyogibacteria bacterium RIFCSPLOWO2_01_FULL_45_48]|uniref:Ribbon-helix-helix protein CopG domain-containing protein n=2 Tax=Candidatus Niyogiibacteriota TaxID=1817912 RepID=A0A1G2EYX1_9BACT|nr:MAG: hypothetical protein A2835_01510 [Candidatus Niyogibacteria bacterium RIFCSPHIGHO2_01_FULL_45_28]OGZ29685.1 MAG: hypothetical protein A2931_01280 [Candidatus Niyogibacteria bacterium RIFCSPLOWO2_01_FULL_45_48]OGZ30448.1 MAG: hypothetical protein A3J00_04230 [Candidatus Niyogibacteria bacterium RIFCSPLOWO2_02_FULL_45_13]
MRNIINISLSKELNQEVEKRVKKGHYSSKSEYFRELIREKVEEDRLVRELEESHNELAMGKGKILRSLKDLR